MSSAGHSITKVLFATIMASLMMSMVCAGSGFRIGLCG